MPTLPSLTGAILLVFAATLGLDWPQAPLNARLADALFPFVLVVIALTARSRPKWSSIDWLVVGYLAAALPSLAVSTNLRASLVELAREGYLAAVYWVVAIAVVNGLAGIVARGLAIGGASLAVVGLAFVAGHVLHPFHLPAVGEVMALPYLGSVLRLYAFTASPAMLACVLTTALPFAMGLASCADGARARRLWTVAAIAIAVAAPFTFSHGIAGMAVAAIISGWTWLGQRRALRAAAIIAAAAAILAFNAAAAISIKQVRVGERSMSDATVYQYGVDSGRFARGPLQVDYAVMSYWRLKEEAWHAFLQHPIAGVGLDRFQEVSLAAFEHGRLTSDYRAIDPHSTLLGRLAETGIIGGAALVLLWIGFAVTGLRVLRGPSEGWIATAAVAALAGLFVVSLNIDVMNFRFLWVAAGLITGIDAIRSAQGSARIR